MSKFRELPKIAGLREIPALDSFPGPVRTRAARAAVAAAREALRNGARLDEERIEEMAVDEAERFMGSSIRRVINASGVVLHTGLGRARLSERASDRVRAVAESHCALEIDLDTGERGDRQSHVRELLIELSGAQDAFVVNNGAAAIFLALNSLCLGREVLLSRGQMVEIGGQFRMPDIVSRSGCALVEVGCTNRTRISDYAEAITERTGAILRCHTSNFKIVGFQESVEPASLRSLATERGLLFLDDLGSGCLVDTSRFGVPREPTLRETVACGADVVTCSGDKLLGGPQAGIIVGSSVAIARIRTNPLARVVRIDKLTLAALEATLQAVAAGAWSEIPTLWCMSRNVGELRRIALRWRRAYAGPSVVEPGVTEVGGGSLPGAGLPTFRLGLAPKSPEALAKELRARDPAILCRIEKGKAWLDPRTVGKSEVREVEIALRAVGTK